MASGKKHKLEIYECLEEYQGLSFKNVEFTAAKDNSTDVATIDFFGELPPPLKRRKSANVS